MKYRERETADVLGLTPNLRLLEATKIENILEEAQSRYWPNSKVVFLMAPNPYNDKDHQEPMSTFILKTKPLRLGRNKKNKFKEEVRITSDFKNIIIDTNESVENTHTRTLIPLTQTQDSIRDSIMEVIKKDASTRYFSTNSQESNIPDIKPRQTLSP